MADETKQPGLSNEQINELVDAITKGRGVEKLEDFPKHSVGGTDYERQLRDFKLKFGTTGVELDPSGLAPKYRITAGLAQTDKDKLAVYHKLFGKENVKPVGESGKYLIRIIRDGKPVDLLDDEAGLSGSDVLDLSGYVPEIATELATAAKLLPKWTPQGLLGYLGTAAASVGAGKVAGGLKDVGLRALTDQPIDPKEIASRRLKEAAIEIPLGGVLPWGSQKVISKLRPGSLTGGVDDIDRQIARQGTEASAELKKAGIDAPLSAGEQTGSRKIQEYEALSERVARLVDPTTELRAAQEAALKEGQASLTSRAATGVEPIGQRVSKELGRAEADVIRKAQDVSEHALKTADQRAREATGFDVSQSVVGSGERARSGLQRVVQQAKDETDALYGKARQMLEDAGGDERFVIPTETQKVGKRLSADETLVKETTETKEPLIIGGDPIEEVTTEPIGWAVDAYNQAKSFADMGGTPQSIEAMRRARSVFGDAIGAAEARGVKDLGGGFSVLDAKQFYKSLSKDIDESLKALSPEVAAAYKVANSQSHQTFEKYTKNKLWHQIRHSAEEGGFDEVSDIISHFSSGKGKPEALKKLGKLLDAEDYAELKRGIVADLTSDASVRMPSGMEFVDFGTLQKNLTNLRPEYKFEIFGGRKQFGKVQQALSDFDEASKLADPKKGVLRTPTAVSADKLRELENAVNDPRMFQSIKDDILEAIRLKDVQQRAFHNDITGKIRSRSLKEGDINTDQFIDDFILKANDHKLVREALNQLPEEMHKEIAQETLKRLFQQSNDLAKQSLDDLAAEGPGVIRGEKLKERMYGAKGNRKILNEVIPTEYLDKMDNLIKYQMAIENARRNAASVGSFARDYVLTSPIKSAGNIAMAATHCDVFKVGQGDC